MFRRLPINLFPTHLGERLPEPSQLIHQHNAANGRTPNIFRQDNQGITRPDEGGAGKQQRPENQVKDGEHGQQSGGNNLQWFLGIEVIRDRS